MAEEIRPGVHPDVKLDQFLPDERNIISVLAREWFVTRPGEVTVGVGDRASRYRYALIKPTPVYQDMFNLDREIVVILSAYERFEPRTFDAIERVMAQFPRLRLEKLCSVVISRDTGVTEKVRDLLKKDDESQIVVPFAYDELLGKTDDYFIRNRFREHFYTRDLFAFQGPLRRDRYFFGRTDLIHRIVNRHASNENSGLFGLRRSGKTSVIYGVQRALDATGAKSVYIDCHDTAFHQRRWHEALWYVIYQTARKYNLPISTNDESAYTEKNASLLFDSKLSDLHARWEKQPLLLIFDEIENIAPETAAAPHWASGNDFLLFWQSLRSAYQRLSGVFSYLVVGTNPRCIEQPTAADKPNPLFLALPFEYLPPFDVPQTREMIRKLGRTMGLRFEEVVYAKLVERYGGHPFLMRHVASVITRMVPPERPVNIGRVMFERAADAFDEQYINYVEMVIQVLEQHYKDEFDMLQMLALGETESFKSFARDTPQYTSHLLGYGLIARHGDDYDFRIDAVKKYLIQRLRIKKLRPTGDEAREEISRRRNSLEPRLRLIVRNQLRATYGEAEAKTRFLKILGSPRRESGAALAYKDLFDPNRSHIYLEDLRKTISKEWPVFANIFGGDQNRFNSDLRAINEYRVDAHAKEISQDELSYFRICTTRIEKLVDEHLQ